MVMDRDALHQVVNSKMVPVFPTSFAEIKEGLIEKHGTRGWIGAYAQAVTGSDKRSGKEYNAARRSLERYETGQYKTLKKYGAPAQVEKVGQTLPPTTYKPPEQFSVNVKGSQGQRDRSWTVTFKGADAYRFARNPTYKEFFKKLGYKADIVEAFDGDDSSGVEVTSVS